jgi:succinyl-diaminopimelate desuccinylase
MPFLGINAIDHMTSVLDRLRRELVPALAQRTTSMPVVPDAARHATLNINAIAGGQAIDAIQTPCVADVCRVIVDRRFLSEEHFADVRSELESLIAAAERDLPGLQLTMRDLMVVHPVCTPDGSPLVRTLERRIADVLGRRPVRVASPGTYDHKHVDRIAGIKHCVAYGPGVLDVAHQVDEWCAVNDLVNATKVLALSLVDLCT